MVARKKKIGIGVVLKRADVCILENVGPSKAYRVLMDIARVNGHFLMEKKDSSTYARFPKTGLRKPNTKIVTIKMYAEFRGLTIDQVMDIYNRNLEILDRVRRQTNVNFSLVSVLLNSN